MFMFMLYLHYLMFFFFLHCRSMHLRAVKSTKKASSSLSWRTWSKTTDGSDFQGLPAMNFECSVLNFAERQPSATMFPLLLLHLHSHYMLIVTLKGKMTEEMIGERSNLDVGKLCHRNPLLKIMCSPSTALEHRAWVWLFPYMLTSVCGDMATTVWKEIDFTQKTCISSDSAPPPGKCWRIRLFYRIFFSFFLSFFSLTFCGIGEAFIFWQMDVTG